MLGLVVSLLFLHISLYILSQALKAEVRRLTDKVGVQSEGVWAIVRGGSHFSVLHESYCHTPLLPLLLLPHQVSQLEIMHSAGDGQLE